jgi:hypothetical protein
VHNAETGAGATMTPADRRINELIDKWLASVDLHLQYVELSDAAYARAQPWPKHDRPSRWVLEVARQKILELKQHSETRQAMGDGRFAESLELMAFLANLVGIQNIQRFIPLADPTKAGATSTPVPTLEASTAFDPVPVRRQAANEEPTREMPRLKPQTPPPAKPVSPTQPKAPLAKPAAPAATAKTATKTATKTAPESEARAVAADMKGKIIADAIRLLKWGKPWHELAELIGRIAERPPVPEIRKVLRAHKADIEAKSGQAS